MGAGKGRGFTVNIPWDCEPGRGSVGSPGDAEYLLAFERVIEPVCAAFGPDIVLVSAGFDAALGDPLGGCRVTPGGYHEMTRRLQALPSAKGRVLVALEGGYSLQATSRSMAACCAALLGDPCPVFQRAKPSKRHAADDSQKPAPEELQGDDEDEEDEPSPVSREEDAEESPSAAAHPFVAPATAAGPRFRERIEEVREALAPFWPTLRSKPDAPPKRADDGHTLRLRIGNTYRRIGADAARKARNGPTGATLVHEWTLYLRQADAPVAGAGEFPADEDALHKDMIAQEIADNELAAKIARVEFLLDDGTTLVTQKRPPYAVARRSWSAGVVEIRVFFKPPTERVSKEDGQQSEQVYTCRPCGAPPPPLQVTHPLNFSDGGASTVHTVAMKPAAAGDGEESGLSAQDRRRAALERRRERFEPGAASAAIGAMFFRR